MQAKIMNSKAKAQDAETQSRVKSNGIEQRNAPIIRYTGFIDASNGE